MVTSSAVVGSSAIRTLGLQASAIAIMARWRMPPESWCGYSLERCAGSGMRTRSSISIERLSACRLSISRCRISASDICRPMVMTGLSDVIGSWKIIEISLPRTSRISSSLILSRSRPASFTEPETMRPGGSGIRRIRESAVMLLPQPDSPTMARVSPEATLKSTASTALTMPWRV